MRYYTPVSLAAEYRKRHCGSIALLIELIEEEACDVSFSLCVSTDGRYGDFIQIDDPFSFFQLLLFKEEGRVAICPFTIPTIEESCRDVLHLMHSGCCSMH